MQVAVSDIRQGRLSDLRLSETGASADNTGAQQEPTKHAPGQCTERASCWALSQKGHRGINEVRWLLSPHGVDDFFHNHWEFSHLHIARGKPGYYRRLMSMDLVDRAIQYRLHSLEQPFKVDKADNGTGLPNNLSNEYGSPYEAYLDGGAVTFERFERSSLTLLKLCSELQALFYFARANIYFSPAGMQTFNLHADSGDIFVVQLSGKKTWMLYERNKTVIWPIVTQLRYGSLTKQQVGPPKAIVELSAGDMLYVPRGMAHEVRTTDSASVHMTISLATGDLSWGMLMQHAFKVTILTRSWLG